MINLPIDVTANQFFNASKSKDPTKKTTNGRRSTTFSRKNPTTSIV